MAKYLDYQGVSTLWNKMKSYVDTKAGGDKLAIDGSTQMQGDIEFSQLGHEGSRGLIFNVASNDYARIVAGANGFNNGYLEIATADDGTEPIYVRQYSSGKFAQLARTATLLDESGNTVFPNEVYAKNNKILATQEYVNNKISGVSGSSYKLNLLWSGNQKEAPLTPTDGRMYVISFGSGYAVIGVYINDIMAAYGGTMGLIGNERYFWRVVYYSGGLTCRKRDYNSVSESYENIKTVYEIV